MGIKIHAVALACLTLSTLHAALIQVGTGSQTRSQSSDANSRSVWDGVFTNQQADSGYAVYHKECEVCHADSLTGGDEVPPLAGAQFLSNWNGLTLGDLFERIRKTMPANQPGKLTSEQNADVIAYLLAFNTFPSGKTELAPNAELLKQIRIESTKPDPPHDK